MQEHNKGAKRCNGVKAWLNKKYFEMTSKMCQQTALDGGVTVACSTHAGRPPRKNGLWMMTARAWHCDGDG